MCALTGVIFGTKRRRPAERRHLAEIFARLLVAGETRGFHAAGVARLDRDGDYRICKRAIPAAKLVERDEFRDLVAGVDERTTLLMGHTRWRTRGDERNNRNNQPILAGSVLGTHNGTISNADELFERLRLRRAAEVDSEVFFRMADASICWRGTSPRGMIGRIDLTRFLPFVAKCRGQIAAVIASLGAPGEVLVLKGNRPIAFLFHRRYRALLYASEEWMLAMAIDGESGWKTWELFPMCWARFQVDDLETWESDWFDFRAEREAPALAVVPAAAGRTTTPVPRD